MDFIKNLLGKQFYLLPMPKIEFPENSTIADLIKHIKDKEETDRINKVTEDKIAKTRHRITTFLVILSIIIPFVILWIEKHTETPKQTNTPIEMPILKQHTPTAR